MFYILFRKQYSLNYGEKFNDSEENKSMYFQGNQFYPRGYTPSFNVWR